MRHDHIYTHYRFQQSSVMKRTFLILLTALLTVTCCRAVVVSSAVPDFAYPQQVSETARKDLAAALKKGDGAMTVNALVRYGLAQNAIDTANLPEVITKIEDVLVKEKSPETKALLNMLLADIYNGIYNADRWKYDNRQQPLLPLPADYTEWSGDQFRHRITLLLNSSLADREQLKASPLKQWNSIITADEYTYRFFPTLYDMAAYHAIEIFKSYSDNKGILPLARLSRNLIGLPLPKSIPDSLTRRVHTIYNTLVDMHRDRPAAEIYAEISRLSFMKSLVYSSLDGLDDAWDESCYEIYDRYADSEYCAEALCAIRDYQYQSAYERKQYYAKLKDYTSRYPDYFRINEIKNRITALERPSIGISCNDMAAKDRPFAVKVSASNVNKVKLSIYKVADADRNRLTAAQLAKPYKTLTATIAGTAPFSADTTLTVTLDRYGSYIIIPSDGGSPSSDRYHYSAVTCTDMAMFVTTIGKQISAWVTDNTAGHPLKGIDMTAYLRNKNSVIANGLTGADGHFATSLPEKNGNNFTMKAVNGSDNAMPGQYVYRYYSDNDTSMRPTARCFTSLPLYRLGDTVQWSAVAYETSASARHLLTGTQLVAELRDANYQTVDTLHVLTDELGRATGKFKLPENGITGQFAVNIIKDKNSLTTQYFNVSDYKQPTFELKFTDIIRRDSFVTVTGKAITYSGFPLADCKIAATLKASTGFWWWGAETPAFYNADTVTDTDGTFTVRLTPDIFALSPISAATYTFAATATSPAGESISASTRFSTGKPYYITVDINHNLDISDGFKVSARAINPMGEYMPVDLIAKIMRGDTVVARFPLSAPDVAAIPSGRYDIEIEPADTTLATAATRTGVVLYRPTDRDCPVDTDLWIAESTLTTDSGNASILYGTTCDDANILAITSIDGVCARTEWLTPGAGLHHYSVTMPEGSRTADVTFAIVHDLKSTVKEVSVKNSDAFKSLTVTTETFRDRITPGNKETWRFHISRTDGTTGRSALILDMCAKAITDIAPADFNFTVGTFHSPRLFTSSSLGKIYHNNFSVNITNLNVPRISVPAIDMYGQSFTSRYLSRNIRIRGTANLTADSGIDEVNVVREYKAAATVESALTGAVSGIAVAEDEEVSEDTAATGTTDSGAGSTTTEQQYRPSEIPLAFFEPTLTSDADGNVDYTFTVPDANTTWNLYAVAYNRDLLTAALQQSVIASKPVMVQPVMPRFLRYGDSTVIRASVMNATDSVRVVTTTATATDISASRVIASVERTDTVSPNSSVIVPLRITSPSEGNALIYRIRSATDRFADGEQSVIPLLPASQPVIESMPLFMAADSTSMTVELPAAGDADVTLQIWEDPIWEIVTALPGLRSGSITTVTEAASALYSAAVADGLMRSHPVIARELRRWLESDQADTTLVSMLQRNDDLKQIMLNATPWVSEAMNDTERMTRLALLFDRKEVNSTISRCIYTLVKLQQADGGWAWTSHYDRSSEWASYRVLAVLSSLKRQGWLPTDSRIDSMLKKGVAYLDAIVAEQYRRNPKADFTEYLYIRSRFNDIRQSSAARRAAETTLQHLVSGWKSMSPAGKAMAAIVLFENRYPSTARQVIASLREYARTSAVNGMWWPSIGNSGYSYGVNGPVSSTAMILDAFRTVTPSANADIQAIRQWLIRQKEGQAWGTSAATSTVIGALLSSEPSERATQPMTVTIGGDNVTSDSPSAKGWLVSDITRMLEAPATMNIYKGTASPSWGSVITRRIASMDEIKAVAGEDVSIEKRILVSNGTGWAEASDLRVGDKVRIQLVVKASRDLDYVTIVDNRGACLQPVDQLSQTLYSERICFFRENRDDVTNIFVDRLPRGTYLLDIEMYVTSSGRFASGIATIQSQLTPSITAHSAGSAIDVRE